MPYVYITPNTMEPISTFHRVAESSPSDYEHSLTNGSDYYDPEMPAQPLYKGVKLGLFTGLYALVFVLGIFGNILTTVVIVRTKDLHSNTNFFLCNLAFSDLVLLLSGIPFDLLYIWRPYPVIAGTWFCILKGWLSETASNVSILTILLLTLERWVAVCWPLHLFIIFDRSKIFRYIFIIWCIGGTAAFILAVQLGVVPHYSHVTNRTYHDITQCDVVPSRTIPYVFEVFSVLLFIVPIVLIISSYASIVRELKRPTETPISALGHVNQPQHRAKHLVIKMCIVVSVIFIVCFLPLHVQRMLTTYLKHQKLSHESTDFIQTWYVVSGLLHFVSASSNPVIYNALSKRFRIACGHFLRSVCQPFKHRLDWSTQPLTRTPSVFGTRSSALRSRLVQWFSQRRNNSSQAINNRFDHNRRNLLCNDNELIDLNKNANDEL